MSISLARPQIREQLAVPAEAADLALAADLFAATPGVIVALAVIAALLVAAIGRVLAILWALLRQVLALLGTLVLGLAAVVVLAGAALSGSGTELPVPAPTVTAHPTLVARPGAVGDPCLPSLEPSRAGNAPAGTPRAGNARAGTPRAGTPRAGTPEAGTPRAGTPRGSLSGETPL
jgi:hypothetical protein